jgi:hypothetical protein
MRVRFPNFVPTARKNDKVHLELMGHLKTWNRSFAPALACQNHFILAQNPQLPSPLWESTV